MNGGQGAWIPQTWATCSLLNLPPYHPEQCFSKCLPGPPAAAAAGAAPERLFEMQIQTYWSLGVGLTVWLPSPSRWLWCLFLGKRRLSISSESPAPQKNNQGATAHTPVCSSLGGGPRGHERSTDLLSALKEHAGCQPGRPCRVFRTRLPVSQWVTRSWCLWKGQALGLDQKGFKASPCQSPAE